MALLRWPVERRDAWVRRANELQGLGHPWDEAEVIAFEELYGGAARVAAAGGL
jgi:hypothetical protein